MIVLFAPYPYVASAVNLLPVASVARRSVSGTEIRVVVVDMFRAVNVKWCLNVMIVGSLYVMVAIQEGNFSGRND